MTQTVFDHLEEDEERKTFLVSNGSESKMANMKNLEQLFRTLVPFFSLIEWKKLVPKIMMIFIIERDLEFCASSDHSF